MDDYSHYVFTPRDLTSWVLGLMRYPLSSSSEGGKTSAAGGSGPLLEMWAYEACRLFRDRLVGEKAHKQFDEILTSVVRADWSLDLSSLMQEGGAMYVTWAGATAAAAAGQGQGQGQGGSALFGKPLGRLSSADMEEVVAKGVVSYGELRRVGEL